MFNPIDILIRVNGPIKCAELDHTYKRAENLTKYRRLVTLISCGYRIPYHHRPKCKQCGCRYLPAYAQDYTCAECARFPKKQLLSLSVTDCRELDMTYPEILRHLALPQDKSLYTLIDDWIDEEEDHYIELLKQSLGEI